jgi:hypothetical protein
MPLMTRINGRPIMLTFTGIPLTSRTEIREVFSDNAYRLEDYDRVPYYMGILMTWPEFGWNVNIYAPIRNLECRGPRDRVNGPSIYAQAWNKEWGVP